MGDLYDLQNEFASICERQHQKAITAKGDTRTTYYRIDCYHLTVLITKGKYLITIKFPFIPYKIPDEQIEEVLKFPASISEDVMEMLVFYYKTKNTLRFLHRDSFVAGYSYVGGYKLKYKFVSGSPDMTVGTSHNVKGDREEKEIEDIREKVIEKREKPFKTPRLEKVTEREEEYKPFGVGKPLKTKSGLSDWFNDKILFPYILFSMFFGGLIGLVGVPCVALISLWSYYFNGDFSTFSNIWHFFGG